MLISEQLRNQLRIITAERDALRQQLTALRSVAEDANVPIGVIYSTIDVAKPDIDSTLAHKGVHPLTMEAIFLRLADLVDHATTMDINGDWTHLFAVELRKAAKSCG